MAGGKSQQFLRQKLLEILEPHLPGIKVEIGRSQRWRRISVTFRHQRFATLLPEQRFRALLQMIPSDLYEKRLRGAVWLELAPGETEQDVLNAPRSEDLAGAEPKIARKLLKLEFFDVLHEEMGENPIEACTGDFSFAKRVLTAEGVLDDRQRDACLVFIRQGAYCDCEVLLAAGPALTRLYGKK